MERGHQKCFGPRHGLYRAPKSVNPGRDVIKSCKALANKGQSERAASLFVEQTSMCAFFGKTKLTNVSNRQSVDRSRLLKVEAEASNWSNPVVESRTNISNLVLECVCFRGGVFSC